MTERNILTIGDIHGLSTWKEFVFGSYEKFENWKTKALEGDCIPFIDALDIVFSDIDYIVFVGDYFDSFDVENVEMKHNVLDIFFFKRHYEKNVFLLWGNHDVQYYLSRKNKAYICEGYRPEMHIDFNEILRENCDLLQVAHQDCDVLWTHAGVTNDFYELYCAPKADEYMSELEKWQQATGQLSNPVIGKLNLGNFLNDMWHERWEPLFFVGIMRGGSEFTPGPLWCDKSELLNDIPNELHQFVGHTPVEQVSGTYDDTSTVCFLDCLGKKSLTPSLVVVTIKDEKYFNYQVYEKS